MTYVWYAPYPELASADEALRTHVINARQSADILPDAWDRGREPPPDVLLRAYL